MDINSKALLVKLSISQWYNRITDRKVANEVADKYQVADHDDRYIKALLPKTALRAVGMRITELRAFHAAHTLPWQDDSVRILASANFFEYRQGIAERKAALEAEVDRFVAAYPAWIEHARLSKKGLFNEMDYPAPQAIAKQFAVNLTMLPFPSAKDFRIEMSKADLAELKASTDQAVAKTMEAANEHLLARLYERAYTLYQALVEPDKVFRDNTVNSLGETLELVRSMNITDDTKVALAVDATKAITDMITPERLRASDNFRHAIAVRLGELLVALKKDA